MEVRGRPLHFGIQLRGQATTWSEYVAALRGVEELGYGSVWMFDHLLPYSGADDRPCFETLTTLGAMATLTTSIRIGVLVNGVLYRDPAVLAKASAQVDEMSEGRLEFTLGAAWAAASSLLTGWNSRPCPSGTPASTRRSRSSSSCGASTGLRSGAATTMSPKRRANPNRSKHPIRR